MVGGTIAHYQVLEKLGAGGMGEVYRARDTRLGRDVAIKALPPAFAQDPERLARFEREAQLLASLNHPNIAAIYGLEQSGGQPYLVLEYVPGDTLHCPLPLEEALPILRQIIDALEEAHERGIVHRDLKPANIKVTPEGKVKVLDFGLAKALSDDPAATNASNSPTLAATALTRSAVLLGTAAYMSPEQARGKPVDKRSDIFAFGAVLYEMLTGQQAFGGETISDSLAAILKNEPDRGLLPAAASANLRRLLDRCLEKDSKRRLRDIGEARIILDTTEPQITTKTPRHQERPWFSLVTWCLGGGIAVFAAALSLVHFRETPPPAPDPVRFTVAPPENGTVHSFSLSPDGRYLAMAASIRDQRSLWIRALDTLELRPLAGTDGASHPFWSPDTRFIGFFAEGTLKKVAVQGGPPQTLCDLPRGQGAVGGQGGTWNRDGVIVFAPPPPGGLFRVPAGGGVPVPVTKYQPGASGTHLFPAFLPDGRHFLFLTGTPLAERRGIYLGSLDSPEIRLLLRNDSQANYVPGPSKTGHILFVRESTLVAQPFDPVRLEFTGDLFPVAEQVRRMFRSYQGFSVSATGALAFASGPPGGGRELVWFDRDGKRLETVGERGAYTFLSLSPDKKRLAVTREDRNNLDIWLLDLARGTASRFTSDPGADTYPTWSPQGDRIAFLRSGAGPSLFWKASSGAGPEELLWKFDATAGPLDWSRDGRTILCAMTGATSADLGLMPVSGDHKPVPLIQAEFNQREARFSPDGRWVAYVSDETGRYEIYVQPVPPSGAKSQVSTGGGRQPEWRGDGRELFYIAPDRKLMAVAVAAGARFEAGVPRPLFETRILPYIATSGRFYDVSVDGRRFLINSEPADTASAVAPITVVTNWRAGAKP